MKVREAVAAVVLVLMAANVVWSGWNFSSVQSFFLSMTYGPFFPGVYAFSVLPVVALSLFAVKASRSLFLGMTVGLGTLAVHEFAWAAGTVLLGGRQDVVGAGYIAIYAAFVGLAVWMKKWKGLALVGLASGCYIGAFALMGLLPYYTIATDPGFCSQIKCVFLSWGGFIQIGSWWAACGAWAFA